MQRHDAADTSFAPDTLAFPLTLAWRKRIEPRQSFQNSPLLASGGVVCLGIDTGIALYDAVTGCMRAKIPGSTALYFKDETLVLLTGGTASTPAARTIYDGGNFFPILTNMHILTQGWLHHVNGLRWDRTGAAWSFSAYRGTAHSLAQASNGKMILAESLNEPVGLAGIAVDTGKIQWQVPLFAGSVAKAKNVFVVSGWHQSELNTNKPGQLLPVRVCMWNR